MVAFILKGRVDWLWWGSVILQSLRNVLSVFSQSVFTDFWYRPFQHFSKNFSLVLCSHSLPSSSWQPLIFLHYSFAFSRISYKCIHTVCSHFCLHPHCCMYQQCVPVYCGVIFDYMDLPFTGSWTFGGCFQFGQLWIKLLWTLMHKSLCEYIFSIFL